MNTTDETLSKREIEQQGRRARAIELNKKLKIWYHAVATAMPGEWWVSDIDDVDAEQWNMIDCRVTDGKIKLHLATGRWREGDRHRCKIAGDYPRNRDGVYCADAGYKQTNPSFTVALIRSPESVGRDIFSRMVPPIRARWAEVMERIAQSEAYEDKRRTSRERLLSVIEGSSQPDHCRDSNEIYARSPYGKVEFSADEVSVGVSYAPWELAKQIIDVVEKWRKENSDEDS